MGSKSRETSEEIASVGADLMNITGEELEGLSLDAAEAMARRIRPVAASAVSQRQADPGSAEAELASTCLKKLQDTTAFGRVIFDNLALVATPTEKAAYNLAEALTKHLTGRE